MRELHRFPNRDIVIASTKFIKAISCSYFSLLVSLLAVFGLTAPSNMAAVVAAPNEMDMVLANVGREMADFVMPEPHVNAADAKNNNLRRAATTSDPYVQSVIQRGARSKMCGAAATTVTISCATGGTISLVTTSGVPKCINVGTNAVKCTSLVTSTSVSAYVVAKCTGNYSMTATLPKHRFTGCNNSYINLSFQQIYMGQICAIKANVPKYTYVFSNQCGASSQLFVDSHNDPLCKSQSSKFVNNTAKTACSIVTKAVKISKPAATNTLCIIK